MYKEDIVFDKEIYGIEDIQKALYRNMAAFTAELKTDLHSIYCYISSNENVNEDSFKISVENFKKDVLDYNLRKKIALETEGIRNLILGVAFSKTGLHDDG